MGKLIVKRAIVHDDETYVGRLVQRCDMHGHSGLDSDDLRRIGIRVPRKNYTVEYRESPRGLFEKAKGFGIINRKTGRRCGVCFLGVNREVQAGTRITRRVYVNGKLHR